MASKRNTYETQAVLSIWLGLVGGLAALAVVALLYRQFEVDNFWVPYGAHGKWLPMFGVALLLALAASAAGFIAGWNSAGQRRNKRSSLSWRGFFLNALVLTVTASAAVFFFFTRFAVQ